MKKHGFSLIEVLIALVIVAIMGTMVALSLGGATDEARVVTTQSNIRTLSNALRLYQSQNGMFPTQEQGLEALVREPTRPPLPPRYQEGGYLDSRNLPLDAWDRPFVYLIPGRGGEAYEIISYGADGVQGGTGINAEISSADL